MTLFIGNNSTGKTTALLALNCMFSEYSSDRNLTRRDFHLPKDTAPEDLEKQELSIEAVFEFDELSDNYPQNTIKDSIPVFFKSMVVSKPGENPYLRIRLEATWEKSSSIEGAIDSKIFYITCPEEVSISDVDKQIASRKDLDQIRVLYVPAIRDPEKQLRNTSAIDGFLGLNSIPIMTIHKSKGLEYSVAYFVGLEDSAFWNFKNQPEENRCAFFVALSRAKHSVIFTYCKHREGFKYPEQKHHVINEFFQLLQQPGMATIIQV